MTNSIIIANTNNILGFVLLCQIAEVDFLPV